jgi:hypothetical protein
LFNKLITCQRTIEFYTEDDARTLKVDDVDEDFYQMAAKATRLQQTAEKVALEAAAVERAKERQHERLKKKKLTLSNKNMDLRTVDIKDLWQVSVDVSVCCFVTLLSFLLAC